MRNFHFNRKSINKYARKCCVLLERIFYVICRNFFEKNYFLNLIKVDKTFESSHKLFIDFVSLQTPIVEHADK